MIQSILDEIKIVIKQKTTWVMVVIICILSLYLLNDFNNKSKEFDNYLQSQVQTQILTTRNDLVMIDIGIKSGYVGNRNVNVSNALEYRKTLDLLLDSNIRKERALNDQDWENYHKEQLFYDYWYFSNLVYDINQLKNQKLIDESYELIQVQSEVKTKMGYPELVFSSDGLTNVLRDYKYFLKNRLLYSYQIVQNEVFTQAVNRYIINGSTFIYQFLSQYWFVLMILQIVLIVERIDKHKTLINFMMSLVNSFIVLVVPILFISFVLFLFNGFSQLNLPVLTNSVGLVSPQGIQNNLKSDLIGFGGNFSLGLSYFSSYPQGSGEMHPYLTFIKLREFYGFVGLLSLFNTVFITSFILLLTNMIKKRGLMYLVVLSISGLGVFLTQINPNSFLLRFNPFSGFNVILINGGSSKITLLTMLIILISLTLILYWFNHYLINQLSSQ